MKRLLGVFVCGFGFIACATGEATGGPSSAAFSGTLHNDLCTPLADAVVVAMGDAGATAVTDEHGAFAYERVQSGTAFLASAPDHVPTLSSLREFSEAVSGAEIYIVPQTIFDAAHALAMVTPDPGRGTVGLLTLDSRNLPLLGAKLRLVGSDTVPGAAGSSLMYLGYVGIPYFYDEDEGTQSGFGAAFFFNVPPGEYEVEVELPGYTFAKTRVLVVQGYVTLDRIIGTGEGAAENVVLRGTAYAPPLFPNILTSDSFVNGGDPVADATLTVHFWDDGSELTTTSDSTGNFEFTLDTARRPYDLTISKANYVSARTARLCLNIYSLTDIEIALEDPFWLAQQHLVMSGNAALHADSTATAQVTAYEPDENGDLWHSDGSRLQTNDPTAIVWYGQNYVFDDPGSDCTVGFCGIVNGTCPAGSRCDGGFCIHGTADPFCMRCDQNDECPSGYTPMVLSLTSFTPLPTYGEDCRCLPQVTDCTVDNTACPEGTYCQRPIDYEADPEGVVLGSVINHVCYPYSERRSSIDGGPAVIHNITTSPLRVDVEGSVADFEPVWFRPEPGLSLFVYARPEFFLRF